ncbi:MAG: hypothetical protein KJN98_07905 [Pontiella sp.]|nr:hypothetical protein [Pontiella sp.]
MPDDWEIQHFGNINAMPEAHGDSDSLNNRDEYIAGTDPVAPDSFFSITNFAVSDRVLQWPSVSDREYTIYWTDSLTNSFQPMGPVIEFPQNSSTDTMHTAEDTSFYKMEVRITSAAQTLWLAETGLERSSADLYAGGSGIISQTAVGSIPGTFEVIQDPGNPQARIVIGTLTQGGQTVTRSFRMGLAYVAEPFGKNAIYIGNDNGEDSTMQMRGTGGDIPVVPVSQGTHYPGGKDSILGDLELNCNLLMQEESYIAPPTINRYGSLGDVEATGTIDLQDVAIISGTATAGASVTPPPALYEMGYASQNDFDVAQIFNDAGIVSGRLPAGHPLENVLQVVKNPANRSTENASTVGDDYYFEPANVTGEGGPASAPTPLILGDDQIYYVDGHVWLHSKLTYGFEVDGQAVIVASRDIHISDNVAYKDRSTGGDLLALVALGQYTGDVRNGYGDIYFGDPEFGTPYTLDAFMLANNDFYYNTRSNDGTQEEPESGFIIFGNLMIVNQAVLYRDWYENLSGNYRAAEYDPVAAKWIDAIYANDDITGNEYDLSAGEVTTLRHYAMRVEYDDRIQDAATQIRGLPRSIGTIFAGVISWEEILP